MPGELLIAAGPGEWRAAWIEDDAALELYVERGDTKPPGSIHLGRVVRLVPSLEALLVDIGGERPAFLPLRHAGDAKREEGARVLAQVRREAWQDKAPRLTAKIAVSDVPALTARAAQLDPPRQLFPEPGFAAALALRLPAMPARIVVDDAAIISELRAAFPGIEAVYRDMADWPIDLDAVFATALSPIVPLRGGGRVTIEELQGIAFVDVDTGTPNRGSAERAALATNRAAATLIGQQLRLRNISGAIAIDFVGLDQRSARDQVRRAIEAAIALDPAKPQVLGWTRLGHLELVRPRRARSLADALLLHHGGAALKQPVTIAHEALRQVQREARANPAANWQLKVPAEVAESLNQAAATGLRALEAKLGRRIAIVAEPGRTGFDISVI